MQISEVTCFAVNNTVSVKQRDEAALCPPRRTLALAANVDQFVRQDQAAPSSANLETD